VAEAGAIKYPDATTIASELEPKSVVRMKRIRLKNFQNVFFRPGVLWFLYRA